MWRAELDLSSALSDVILTYDVEAYPESSSIGLFHGEGYRPFEADLESIVPVELQAYGRFQDADHVARLRADRAPGVRWFSDVPTGDHVVELWAPSSWARGAPLASLPVTVTAYGPNAVALP